jgi:hypothetical protein
MQITETAQSNSLFLTFCVTVDPYKVSLIMRNSSPKLVQLAELLRLPYSLQALSK